MENKITVFLQWNDKNGCYTDEACEGEEVSILSYEEAKRYFFGVVNDDFYYGIADNIFEIEYKEVIRLAKENDFYEATMQKLMRLESEKNPTEDFYRSLI